MTVGIRYRPDTGWEARCEGCAAKQLQCYWPLDLEFWMPSLGMARCRACLLAAKRARAKRARLANPDKDRERTRRYKAANRHGLALKAAARRSEWSDERRAQEREKDRQWRKEHPDRWRLIQRRHREKYADKYREQARDYQRRRRAKAKEAEARAA